MTISTTTTFNAASGTGAVLAFPFTFVTQDASTVKVYLDDVLQDSGYVVSLNSNQTSSPGGTVTFSSAPGSGVVVLVQREVPLTQSLNLPAYGSFSAEAVEAALDRSALIAQDTRRIVDGNAAAATADVAAEEVARIAGDAALEAWATQELAAARGANPYEATSDASTVLATGATSSRTLADIAYDVWVSAMSGLTHRTPRRIFQKFFQAGTGTPSQIRMVVFGDSLASRKPWHLYKTFMEGLGADASVYYAPFIYGSQFTSFCNGGVVTGTYDATVGDGYTYWPTGPLNQITATSRVKFVSGGVDPYFTSAPIYYVKEPGAGSMEVLVNDVVVTTLNAASATVELGKYDVTQAYGQSKVELRGTAGNVRIIGVWKRRSDTSQVETYEVSVGGLTINNATSSAQALSLFGAFMADLNPDLFTVEMDDGGTDIDAPFNVLANQLEASAPTTDKLLIVTTPSSTTEKVHQRDVYMALCSARGYSWHCFDGYTPVAPYSTLVALGWEGDGTHPANAVQAYLAGLLIRQFGLDGSDFRVTSRPLVAWYTASTLGDGSQIRAGTGAGSLGRLKFQSDGAGNDWDIDYYRTLKLKNGAGDVVLQVGNTGVGTPNVLPRTFKWSTSATAQNVDVDGSGGFIVLRMNDTDQSNGGQVLQVGGLKFYTYTKAALPSVNGRQGSLIFVSDGGPAGVPCLAYQRGSFWYRLPDDAPSSGW